MLLSDKRKPNVLFRNVVPDMTDFDWEIYLLNYPDLIQQGIRTKTDACSHYKRIGFAEKRSCSIPVSFQNEMYLKKYGHIGLKTSREAYIHYKKMGNVLQKSEGFKRNLQPYRLPVSNVRKPIPQKVEKPKAPPTTLLPTLETIIRPRSHSRRLYQPFVVRRTTGSQMIKTKLAPKTFMTFPLSRNMKHEVRQVRPGELMLKEPPSSYFRKICTIGPPKYLN